MPVMPVVRESTILKGLSLAVEKIEAAKVDTNLNSDAEISESTVKAKVPRLPYTPGAAEREAHNATHCPFRSWCPLCVAGKAPDPQHLALKQGDERKVPTIEFDYSKASGRVHEPESQLPIITASESQHGAVFSSIIRKKGSQDEYVLQAFLNWISTLGCPTYELKCDQEPSTVDVRNEMIRRCKSTNLVPYASPKASKGSLGRGERAHLSVQGQMRTFRMHVEKKYCIKMQPSHFLNDWACRHAAWIINRFQPRENGKKPYFSMRGRNYSGPVIDFSENGMFKDNTDDKYDDRWLRGLFVGKLDQTDEAILLTPSGVAKARGIRRLEDSERFKLSFLNSCKGLPWNPKAAESLVAMVRQGDPLTAGTKIRNMRITAGILKKFGRSDGCPRCGAFGPSHSTECRLRLEKAMVDSGEAFVVDGQPEKTVEISVDGVGMPTTPDIT